VAAVYVAIALASRFVLIGIVPVMASIRAVRLKERLAPVAVVAAVAAVAVGIFVLSHH
jgi:hypothetical protein